MQLNIQKLIKKKSLKRIMILAFYFRGRITNKSRLYHSFEVFSEFKKKYLNINLRIGVIGLSNSDFDFKNYINDLDLRDEIIFYGEIRNEQDIYSKSLDYSFGIYPG